MATNVATFLNPSINLTVMESPLVSLIPFINICTGVSTVSPVQINKFKMLKEVLLSHLAYQPSQAYQKGGPSMESPFSVASFMPSLRHPETLFLWP